MYAGSYRKSIFHPTRTKIKANSQSKSQVRDIYTVIRPVLFLSRFYLAGPYHLTKTNEFKILRVEAIGGPLILAINLCCQVLLSEAMEADEFLSNMVANPFLLLSYVRGTVIGWYFTCHAVNVTLRIRKIKIVFRKLRNVTDLMTFSQKDLMKKGIIVWISIGLALAAQLYMFLVLCVKERRISERIRMTCVVVLATMSNNVELQFTFWAFLIGSYVKLIHEKLEDLAKRQEIENKQKLKIIQW